MNIDHAYNQWAPQYDSNVNKTRDLEKIALREMLADIQFQSCLEIGCGTGKNTSWLIERASKLIAVDFSTEMLAKAKEKINDSRVQFVQADINDDWQFGTDGFDLIGFSLVLEHISNLSEVFRKSGEIIRPGGYIYLGELHPFKQYAGSKARFDNGDGETELQCYTHHVSEYIRLAMSHGFVLQQCREFFDDNNEMQVPRILGLVFQLPVQRD